MDNRQLTTVSRHINGISAHKVLSLTGKQAVIRLGWGDKTALISSMGEELKSGDWVDLQVQTQSNAGRIGSYTIRYIGKTPSAFVPEDPAAEYIRA